MSSNRKIGGFKATINNPNTSEEAKEHARQQIGELDGESELTDAPNSGNTGRHEGNEGKDETRQNAGFKGVLKNPNVGEEAKKHAKEVLKERGAM
ncbi:uncharacterized protein TRAVEDRAFT_48040 [Trametes versicolor FP-101664 SS1]|uniref:uncharacterized protein n=1 Tax=Trametes versicolor (strain FP-101664) TaxID=717944 RepID=UPI0004623744|nr:uncharacterized protein TRAVEDRAFT_48040 [Trametes versicolor FP-101664 SS1]EIW58897.1 hypothetical protein TRAVEDRAFT_48040 [Trametes versicolor FP-101664 SS1]